MLRRNALMPALVLALAGLFALALPFAARAQYPDRPIRLVVPQAAGSASDNVARVLAAALSQQMGQQVVVDNRPGGALTIGIDIVAKSAPDGYTLAFIASGHRGQVIAMVPSKDLVVVRFGRTSYDRYDTLYDWLGKVMAVFPDVSR